MYYSDKPIESRENDLLGRAQFSKHLARSLLKINLSESITVSITGKWGTGKTSVLNMVQANGYKQWRYLFIPSKQVMPNSSFTQLAKRFKESS